VLRPSNKSQLFLMGDNGDFPKATNFCKLLILLVAGAGFEPATFGIAEPNGHHGVACESNDARLSLGHGCQWRK